jgi:hypothetical protein
MFQKIPRTEKHITTTTKKGAHQTKNEEEKERAFNEYTYTK